MLRKAISATVLAAWLMVGGIGTPISAADAAQTPAGQTTFIAKKAKSAKKAGKKKKKGKKKKGKKKKNKKASVSQSV